MYLREAGQQPTFPSSGKTWNDPTYYGLDTASYGDVLSYKATYFAWVNRSHVGGNAKTILGTGTLQTRMTSSFDVYTDNPHTRWWTKEGGVTKIQNVSQSSVDRYKSFKFFIDQVISGSDPGLYIVTINDAINCDRGFRMGVEENSLLGGTASTTLVNINKPLITFGSFPIGPSKYVGVPKSSKLNTGYYGDPTSNLTNSSPNLAIPDGYAPVWKKYWAQTHRLFSIPTIPKFDAGTGNYYYDETWFGTENNIFDNHYNSITKASQTVEKPFMDNWAMYKLDVKSNIILTDLHKQLELKDGLGKKGYIVIPENLNPEIANNLDFYLAKAGLIDKIQAPTMKDRSIVKNKPKAGFFKKRFRRKK